MKWHEVKHTEREKKNRKNRKYKALTQNLRQFEVTEIEQHHVSGEKDEQKIKEPKSVLSWCRLPSSERRLFLLLSVSSVSSSRSRVVPNLVRNEFVVNDDCVSLSLILCRCALCAFICAHVQIHRHNDIARISHGWNGKLRCDRHELQLKRNEIKINFCCCVISVFATKLLLFFIQFPDAQCIHDTSSWFCSNEFATVFAVCVCVSRTTANHAMNVDDREQTLWLPVPLFTACWTWRHCICIHSLIELFIYVKFIIYIFVTEFTLRRRFPHKMTMSNVKIRFTPLKRTAYEMAIVALRKRKHERSHRSASR